MSLEAKVRNVAAFAFFVAGFMLACWSPMIPGIKADLSLSDAQMGLILLAFGVGSLISMPMAGLAARKLGCRLSLIFSLLCAGVILVLLSTSQPIAFTTGLLFLFGVCIGSTDVLININGVLAQQRSDKSIMSFMHALFSFGAFAGSGVMSFFLSCSGSATGKLTYTLSLVLLLFLILSRQIDNQLQKNGSPVFSIPHPTIIILGLTCWVAYMVEGAMLDWGGIFVTTYGGKSNSAAGYGYAAFSAAMTGGRLIGDRIIAKIGITTTFLCGGALVAGGLTVLLCVDDYIGFIVSFFAIGAGLANVAPIIFSVSGRAHPEDIAHSIAQVSTMGYAGILIGPALIGGVASLTSLRLSFCLIAIMMLATCTRAAMSRSFRA